jgi:2-keto-4-pentenoate hydratase/2-oxohepta-3-ene-1,7-dioic acid hydratase in catechol pathway
LAADAYPPAYVLYDPGDAPPRVGLLKDGEVLDLEAALGATGLVPKGFSGGRALLLLLVVKGAATSALAADLDAALIRVGKRDEALRPGANLMLPFRPGKVIAVGRNYAAHAKEMGSQARARPFFFGKASSSAVGHGEPIVLPHDLEGEVHHEAELGVVIGRAGRRIEAADALSHVAGYLCANDVTARTLQTRLQDERLPWFAGKNADSFLCLGPGLVPADAVPDPSRLRVRGLVGGVVRQDAPTSDMVCPVAELIAEASRHLRLEPLDVILTGTPAGVGPLRPGDAFEVRIDGVGSLVNPVVAEAPPA